MKQKTKRLNDNFSDKLIDLKHLSSGSMVKMAGLPLEKMFSFDKVNQTYNKMQGHGIKSDFFRKALETLNVKCITPEPELSKIPVDGPLIIIANHPFGGLDGIMLGNILSSVRQDFKFLANGLLAKIEEFSSWLLPVDSFGKKSKVYQNSIALRKAIKWLKDGHVIITFPAGEVSHLQLRKSRITDPPWHKNTAAIIRMSGCHVLPMYFHGRNSLLFQLAGLLHPGLRTAMLPNELINKSGRTFNIEIGNAISPAKIRKMSDDKKTITYLRNKVYLLGYRSCGIKNKTLKKISTKNKLSLSPLISQIDKQVMINEINSLPKNQCLAENGEFKVILASADQIPGVIMEIGRLRELTFRQAQEGTGEPADLDEYDKTYLHLFLWHEQSGAVSGAYRLGLCDEIIKKSGVKGLYTNTLFGYYPAIINMFSNALEMGRSFIAPEFQKKHNCLNLLWKGIGEFVNRNPKYNILFGPVSISNDYHPISKDLMISWLMDNEMENKLDQFVQARRPYQFGRQFRQFNRTFKSHEYELEDISAMVSELEKSGRGIPVLLKQYLKLSGKLLGFNVDKSFSDVVDGLILVDLKRTDPKLLTRFMGETGCKLFQRYHNISCVQNEEYQSV